MRTRGATQEIISWWMISASRVAFWHANEKTFKNDFRTNHTDGYAWLEWWVIDNLRLCFKNLDNAALQCVGRQTGFF